MKIRKAKVLVVVLVLMWFVFLDGGSCAAMVLIHRLLHEPLLAVCYNKDADEVGIVLKDKILWWRFVRDAVFSSVQDGHFGPVIALQVNDAQ